MEILTKYLYGKNYEISVRCRLDRGRTRNVREVGLGRSDLRPVHFGVTPDLPFPTLRGRVLRWLLPRLHLYKACRRSRQIVPEPDKSAVWSHSSRTLILIAIGWGSTWFVASMKLVTRIKKIFSDSDDHSLKSSLARHVDHGGVISVALLALHARWQSNATEPKNVPSPPGRKGQRADGVNYNVRGDLSGFHQPYRSGFRLPDSTYQPEPVRNSFTIYSYIR